MEAYKPLQKIFYSDNSSERESLLRKELEKRLLEHSTFKTGIKIDSGELFLAVPKELSILSEKALRVERKVSQLWHELPVVARGAYLRSLILDELISTNEIEGVRSTRKQIEVALESAQSDKPAKPHKRFREFANLYLELTNDKHIVPVSPFDIRKIYDRVVAGELLDKDKPDGELFRKEGVEVTSSTQKVLHKGVMPESHIVSLLEQMIALTASEEVPLIYSALISHFLFEYIHPFYDGNGRTGRYLLALYLSEPLSLPTVLSLSSVVADNKNKYYKVFTNAEAALNYGELTFFVMQMMEFIRMAQDNVMESLELNKIKLETVENLLDSLSTHYQLSSKERSIIYFAAQAQLFSSLKQISLREIADYLEKGLQATRKYTRNLEKKGLFAAAEQKPLKFVLTQEAREALFLKD